MGSRYLYIVLMVLLEHRLSRGDYRRHDLPARRHRWTRRLSGPGRRPGPAGAEGAVRRPDRAALAEAVRWAGGALLLAIVTWPIVVRPPRGDLDPSWRAGLAMAWRDGLQYGTDLIFTYGPWGFVTQPELYDTSAYRIAVLVNLVLWAAAALAVWVAVARTWGRGWAWLVSLLALCSALYVEPAVIASTAIAVLLVQRTRVRLPAWVPVILGLAAGFLLLTKVSAGVQILVVLALALGLRGPGRGR